MKKILTLSANIGKKESVNILVCSGMRTRYKFCDIKINKCENYNQVLCIISFVAMDNLKERVFISKATDRFLKFLSKYEGVGCVKAKVESN